jgi:hypothetical protein
MSKGGFALLSPFNKMDRSTQKLTTGRIHLFDVRPARNALKLVQGKFNNLIHNSMITLTQRTMHGRRVFVFYACLRPSQAKVSFSIKLAAFQASGGAEPLNPKPVPRNPQPVT